MRLGRISNRFQPSLTLRQGFINIEALMKPFETVLSQLQNGFAHIIAGRGLSFRM